jgi:uroporphyrin-III C-methyltransferase / precorrin-2 dehydrogenase / sirohydrochlorin ferrochelatase
VTWPALPLFVRVAGRPVVLVGDGEAATAKRRLLERAGATVVGEGTAARIGFVALEDEAAAEAAVARLRAAGVLVNAVDRPALCDFTVPAIVDRAPVLVAVGTGGVSAGLAAAVRQRLEGWLPPALGRLAEALERRRGELRARFPDAAERRRAIGAALAASDLGDEDLAIGESPPARLERIDPAPADPDDLTLRQARWLAMADRVHHHPDAPAALLDRARADASRVAAAAAPGDAAAGLTVWVGAPG